MRQYELAIRIAQVHHLVDERKYKKALAVIQTLDMRQVRSLSDLKVFAEVYTRTEQFDAAKATYLRIYRRSQTRRVLHRLIYLSIRTNALDEAEMYYQEFVRTNPNERDALIMRYRIDKARGVPIGRLIEILQDLKQEEYIEEWAYELAKLYHRAGRREECIAECEDILLWFGTGEIVERAKILIDHLEERDPMPYYDDKDFTEPGKEAPNPDDTGSLPDLNEFIKKRKAQKKGERLAEHTARREEKVQEYREDRKKKKEEPKPVFDGEGRPETDEEIEREIDRQLESYEEDEMDRELSVRVAEKAQAGRNEEKKTDKTDTASEEFVDDYQEDESFGENMDLPKKAMDGIQKLLKFGKKEEDKDKDKEQEKEEPEKEKADEKLKNMDTSANAGGEREYVPHSQSGTGITQDLAREISAIYDMEHQEQLQEKAVTVIDEPPSNIATDLVERMNQALQHTPKRYIPSDVEEIGVQESGILEADTKDLSRDTDAWVDEADTKDLSKHSARLNRQAKKELRHKPFRREALEKNSAEDARERLMNIVENRRREDAFVEENKFRRDGLAAGQPEELVRGAVEEQPEEFVREAVEEQPEKLVREAMEEQPEESVRKAMEEQPEEFVREAMERETDTGILPEDMTEVSQEPAVDVADVVTELPKFSRKPRVAPADVAAESSKVSGEPVVDTAADFTTEPPEDETELLRLLLEGEVQEPDELSELSGKESRSSDGQGALEELPWDVAEPPILAADNEAEEPENTIGEPERGRQEPMQESEPEMGQTVLEMEEPEPVEEPEPFGRAAFHSVEPQTPGMALEAQLEAELEQLERERAKRLEKEFSDNIEEWTEEPRFAEESEPEMGQTEFAEEPEREQSEFAQKSELVEESGPEMEQPEPEFAEEPEPEMEQPEPEFAEESEPEIEQPEPIGEPEAFAKAVFHSVEPQTLELDLEAQLQAEVEQLEREREKELLDNAEEEWAEEPEPVEEQPEFAEEPEPEIEQPEFAEEPEPELEMEQPEFAQEPEPEREQPEPVQEQPEFAQEPEPEMEQPEFEEEPEPEMEQPEFAEEPEPELERKQPEPGIRRQEQRRQPEPAREQEPEPVNRLSREMAAYHAPKIPVVETEYMEMPQITYEELPTTRALQESFEYVLQLIEGELEPSHFVLMGDGTERIVGVAKRIVRVMKNSGFISRGRIAKIHAKQLNKMDLISFRSQLFGNCLLIDGAADLLFPTITRMFSIMEEYQGNFVVILADEGSTLDQLFRFVPALAKRFQYIIDISKYTKEDYE